MSETCEKTDVVMKSFPFVFHFFVSLNKYMRTDHSESNAAQSAY